MKKIIILALFSLINSGYSESVWTEFNLYDLNINEGDIIKINFLDKTLIQYNIQVERDSYLEAEGRRASGEMFAFFPDGSISENDRQAYNNQISVNNENEFVIPAKVISVSGSSVFLHSESASIINGDIFSIEITGECNINSIRSDYFVNSTDIYNLEINVRSSTQTVDNIIDTNNLIFTTNYSNIQTNILISTNGITNTDIITDLSSINIEFYGISDEAKNEIIIDYINFLLNALFR